MSEIIKIKTPIKELLANAETAFSNQQYSVALEWYEKAYKENPQDIYVLSRMGAICVSLGAFEKALTYFGKANEIDPSNGDNSFNYGNALFFNQKYSEAFKYYVEAEKKGCSEDVLPRLYYQMAMLCSLRQDIKSALTYFEKSEDSDTSGMIGLTPDLISEKLKLYMVLQDYINAEKCAAQLVAISPKEFKNYIVYYSILMAHKDFETAEKVLEGAERYADLSEEDSSTLVLQKSALYSAKADGDSARFSEYCDKSIEILESAIASTASKNTKVQLLITLAEMNLKIEQYAKCISTLHQVLRLDDSLSASIEENKESVFVEEELTPEEIEEQLLADIDTIAEKIYRGEIDDNLGAYAELEYDEDGYPVYNYDKNFDFIDAETINSKEDDIPENDEIRFSISVELKEKVYFTFISCFIAQDDFVNAGKVATVLKHSSNKYYSYFARYTEALCTGKNSPHSQETERKYAETISYFRNKSFEDPKDSIAVIFRARLYAEQGKYEKATEISNLLSEEDRKSILKYVEQCKA